MATSLSLLGRGLKLDTRADIEPHLQTSTDCDRGDPSRRKHHRCRGCTGFAEFLGKTTKLRVHRLSDNAFGGRSVDRSSLLSTARSLRVLKLNNNGLGPAGGSHRDALTRLAESLEKGDKSNLRTIICGRNQRHPDGGISSLVHGLAANADLLHLDLQDNTFADEGSKTMAAELSRGSWPSLRRGRGLPVVEALAKGLHTKLEILQLQNDNLESQAFSLLAVVRVEAQWNEVDEDDEAVVALLTALKKQGGKLVINDDEEEEEEEEAEELLPPEAPAAAPALTENKSAADKAADSLADLLEKVSIR
ncbi:hypothetical protein C8Q74DRAFT_1312709 [Fomes fomentarius]|nr:hypothetical protein C8Q74DRAFT_1312709 [Fomes fomentarius]